MRTNMSLPSICNQQNNLSAQGAHAPVRANQAAKVGQFTLGISPKGALHAKFLTACAGFHDGKIEVDLDDTFWSWIKTIDPADISQAYIDGACISGEHACAAADGKTLIQQSQTQADLKLDDAGLTVTDSQYRFALDKLEMFYDSQLSKCFPSLNQPSKTFIREYAAGTGGGDFKQDYALYRRSVDFSLQLRKMANRSSASKCNQTLQKEIAKSKHLASMGIAVKRLEMAHNATTCSASTSLEG